MLQFVSQIILNLRINLTSCSIVGTTVASDAKKSNDLEKNFNNPGSTDQSIDPGLASRMGSSRNGPSDSTTSKTSKSLFDQNSFAVGGVVSNLSKFLYMHSYIFYLIHFL